MDIIVTFSVLAGIIFIGFFAEIIFKKANIPDVLILICLGIFLGPVKGYISPNDLGEGAELFTTFALVFILFQGAINIDFKTLLKSLSNTFKLTTTSFFLTVVVVTTIAGVFLNYNPMISLIFAVILAGTSSAVVIPLVKNVEIADKYGLVLTLESAVSDVLCIIGVVTILEIMKSGNFVASQIFKHIITSFSLALVIGLVAGVIWIFMIYNHPDLLTSYIITIAIIIGLYAFVESAWISASGAIAVLAFGLTLGNSKTLIGIKGKNKTNLEDEDTNSKVIKNVLSPSSKVFYSEISFFVKTFFFVYLGILMDFSNPWILMYGAIITLGIYLIRPLAVKYVFLTQRVENKEKTILEILIPKGLAAAVLAQLVFQKEVLGSIGQEFVSIILSVVFFSILLTSILIFLSEKDWFKGFYWFLGKKEKGSK